MLFYLRFEYHRHLIEEVAVEAKNATEAADLGAQMRQAVADQAVDQYPQIAGDQLKVETLTPHAHQRRAQYRGDTLRGRLPEHGTANKSTTGTDQGAALKRRNV